MKTEYFKDESPGSLREKLQRSVCSSQGDEEFYHGRQKSPAKCLQRLVSVVVSGPSMSASARLTPK